MVIYIVYEIKCGGLYMTRITFFSIHYNTRMTVDVDSYKDSEDDKMYIDVEVEGRTHRINKYSIISMEEI